MADYISPSSAKSKARRGYAFAIAVAGALLVVCAILPWAGTEARSDLLGGGLIDDVRGIDDQFGVYTLIAGLVSLGLGVTGLLSRPMAAVLAVVPGLVATVVLVMFVADPRGISDRVSIDLGRFLSIEPVIRYGWFAALACALAVVALSLASLTRRRRS